jgi:pyridoxal phosphate enzyme (YggS family)
MPFSELPQRVAEVQSKIADAVRRGGHGQAVQMIAVTKTHGVDAVEAAWHAGIGDVGENKVQEAVGKQALVHGDAARVRWHLIGHLQRNKVRQLEHFTLFHALDRPELADAVHSVGAARNRPIDVLVQVNVAGEATKGGYEPGAMDVEADRLMQLSGLRVLGAMVMAPLDADEKLLRAVFSGGRAARDVLRRAGHPADALSMGMSGDYEIAVEEGATLVRLGTVLFGTRA